jgi:zinc transport system substrate-binding protein
MKELRTLLAIGAVAALSCGGGTSREPQPGEASSAEGATSPLSVYVVNYPLAYMAQRIGGAEVNVSFPAPAEEDPAHWSPAPETVAAYQGADLILLNGADYAKWVAQASLPPARLVDTGAAYAERLIPLEEAVTHAHGPEGEHAHVGVAFTTWLDPTLALEQSRATAAAFEKARPGQAAAFRERLASLEADLTALDTRLEATAAAIGDRALLFSHPVYQYLERRYDLNGQSVHWEPDAEPSERQWAEVEKLLETHRAEWMVWEAEPLPSIATRLKQRGVTSVVFDPCSRTPGQGDLLSVMGSNVDRLEGVRAAASSGRD